MTDESPPLTPSEAAKEPDRARLREIAGRLAKARAEAAAIYLELEAAVREVEPNIGAGDVVKATGLSRARVYQIIPRKGAKSPKGEQ